MSLRHFIITRFNVAYDFSPNRNPPAEQRLDEGWLRRRLELFRKYTVPSVQGQTLKDFVWYLCVDMSSPSWLKDLLWSEGAAVVNCLPEDWLHNPRMLAMAATDRGDIIMTTRLDSDDCIDRDFVARLRVATRMVPWEVAAGERVQWLDPVHGYTLDEQSREMRSRFFPTNASPFCSCLEMRGKDLPATVYSKPHNEVDAVGYGGGQRMFVQVCHGGNVANVPGEGAVVADAPTIMMERYGVQL